MGLKEDLIAAKALIDTPEKWRGESGQWAGSIIGSLAASTGSSTSARYDAAKRALVARLELRWRVLPTAYDALTAFGDSSTHADIMSLFDRAIAAAESQP